ncbi:hypothetical protein [Actinokineospora cianjurensis]|uniref:Uncharacterized protein n=1 Tax=Actinokineospora cianjurensis TaxID=585224 RepID=A0A421B172_9PSEU|nr:hypothetical protein [Actinokineospora cianjurensis]RLK58033.1 hypothetical protein CLV68_4125 [Actinokineospora cianjurensis]
MADQERVRGIARAIVGKLAPEELVFFEPASEAYFRDRDRDPDGTGGRARRDPLAFGVTEVVALVTPVALVVSAAIADEVVGRTATAVVDRGVRGARWLRHKVRGGNRPELPARVEFDEHELARIRASAAEKARAMGLAEEQVSLFVDALIGGLTDPSDGS